MTAAEGIPEGFRSDESGRVAPGGKEATSPGTRCNLIRCSRPVGQFMRQLF